MPLYLVMWLHLIAVITFIGGLLFIHMVLRPALQGLTPISHQSEVLRRVGQRFRTLAWVSLITLILTGSYSILNESGSARIETMWGVVLMVKLFVFAITLGLVLIHDFILDPYGTPSGGSFDGSLLRDRVTFFQQAILMLTLAILLIACYLSSM